MRAGRDLITRGGLDEHDENDTVSYFKSRYTEERNTAIHPRLKKTGSPCRKMCNDENLNISAVSVLRRCPPYSLFEVIYKMTRIIEAGFERYLRDGHIRARKHLACLGYPVLYKILIRALTDRILEASAAFACADSGGAGYILKKNIISIVFVDERKHSLHPFLLPYVCGSWLRYLACM